MNDLANNKISNIMHKNPAKYSKLSCSITAFLIVGTVICTNTTPANEPVLKIQHCHDRKSMMVQYFKRAKNPHPEEMAVAVLSTKSPKLLAAMATKGEKNTPYTVRKGGYKNRHAGAWQVNEKDWGKVPLDPIGQALKTEDILKDLTATLPIDKALSAYGGDSTPKYSNRVLAELVNVP